jgi:hypothetical protein
MTQEWNQRKLLLLGSILSFPSLVLAGVAAGAVASRRATRTVGILSQAIAPAVLIPLFSGIGLYLHRLVTVHFPSSLSQQERDAILEEALVAAKASLDLGILTAGLMLGAFIVVFAGLLLPRGPAADNVTSRGRWAIQGAVPMLILAGLFTWMTGPMAAENDTPVPGHDRRTTQRLLPPASVDLGRDELFRLSGHSSIGPYQRRLFFPMVTIEQEPLVHWSPMLTVSGDAVSVDGIVADSTQALRRLVMAAQNNERSFRGHVNGPLIAAAPAEPLSMVAKALAAVYDTGYHEVRLVTGLPQTIERPVLGALSRVALQTTTVMLVRAEGGQPEAPRGVPLAKSGESYRQLLDRVLAAGQGESPLPLVLASEGNQ